MHLCFGVHNRFHAEERASSGWSVKSVLSVTCFHRSISSERCWNFARARRRASEPSTRCNGGSLASTASMIARAARTGSPVLLPGDLTEMTNDLSACLGISAD